MGTEYGKYSAWEQSTENIVHGNSVRKNGKDGERSSEKRVFRMKSENKARRRGTYTEGEGRRTEF